MNYIYRYRLLLRINEILRFVTEVSVLKIFVCTSDAYCKIPVNV